MFAPDARVVVVTGASRGIGAAIAADRAACGDRVFAFSRNGQAPEGVTDLRCDVGDAGAVRAAIAAVGAQAGRIDAVVNNAGTVLPIGVLADADVSAWSDAIRSNLEGPFFVIRYALPLLLAAGGGVILNISSGAAARPLEGWSAYCTSKAGLAMLTRCVNEEYRARGVHCVSLRPGLVDTALQAAIRDSGINPVSRIPREQLIAPAFVARAAGWLIDHYRGLESIEELDIRDEAFLRISGLGTETV
jgi:NAD(P)-dependent dehydrogenase (short-subunit alcohol dehydrogenase family)